MSLGSATFEDFHEIPIVDLARWHGRSEERLALADEVRSISHDVGFFMVVNHGVDRGFVDSIFELMERLFALPIEQKTLIDKRRSRHFRGWEQVGSEYTNNRPDFREQVDTWSETEARPADVEPAYLRLLGPNQWLPDDVLPGHRELTLEWFDRLGAVAVELMGVLSVGLGLPPGHLDEIFGDRPMSLTKFIHYPPTPPGGAGVNAHHDAGFLTVLAPGPTAGLEVQNRAGEWVPVPSVPDSFVVNLGEMLQGMTGNYYVATPHRVVTTEERYSAGYFHGPTLDTPLTPLPLDAAFVDAVAASPHHTNAGFMARKDEVDAGVGDMRSSYRPQVYGEQVWNYLARSYPDLMASHYPATT
jgi:isopenicillin N synthase-like dioxygenase